MTTASEVLAELYDSAVGFERMALDKLVERTGHGWRCQAPIRADDGDHMVGCDYLNQPVLWGKPADAPCSNCGAARPNRG